MTADIAVAAGRKNLSVANHLAYLVDSDYTRTLSIITKADKALEKVPEVLAAAVARSSKHGSHTGCVLVSIAHTLYFSVNELLMLCRIIEVLHCAGQQHALFEAKLISKVYSFTCFAEWHFPVLDLVFNVCCAYLICQARTSV
jgi:hypothetical protein